LLPKDFIIGIIERDEDVIIPSGEDILQVGDIVYIPLKKEEIEEVAQSLGVYIEPAKR